MELDSGWMLFNGCEVETEEIDKSSDKDDIEDDGDEL
jgi:hypothetical protein